MYRTSEKLLTTGRNLLHAVWNASHCDRWNFWRQLKTCYGGKDEIAPRGYTGLADDTLGSRGPGSASSLLGITCFYHPFDSTEQSILPAVWRITRQAVFGKPVAESLPDEANGTDLSGGKSAETSTQHTKPVTCGKDHSGTVEHKDEDTGHTLWDLLSTLRYSFLSFSPSRRLRTEKWPMQKLSVRSDLCVRLWYFWEKHFQSFERRNKRVTEKK